MAQILIPELWACTPETLARRLGVGPERANLCIETLTTRGVLKLKTDNETREYGNGSQQAQRGMYQFVYVGLAIFEDIVFMVYPKYLKEEDVTPTRLRTTLKVLRKSAGSYADIAAITETGLRTNDRLALMLMLLEMYEEHGLYENEERVLRTNGGGDINWERTIAMHDAHLSSGVPIYLDYETNETTRKTADFITRLHRFALTESSKFMQDNALNELLSLDELELTADEREDLGDANTIAYRLERERAVQFVTWKQRVLDLLLRYFNDEEVLARSEKILCLGTTSFYHVWEEACCVALGDISRIPIRNLGIDLRGSWLRQSNKTLLELMPCPQWYKQTNEGEMPCGEASTLVPDALTLTKHEDAWSFGIFDAKYYTPTFGETVSGAPGVESITKQQLYQSAYKGFVMDNGVENVANIFVIPSRGTEIAKVGRVDFSEVMGREEPPFVDGVTMYALPAERIWECYLKNESLPGEILKPFFSDGVNAVAMDV